MTHPIHYPGQTFDEHQQAIADWMGCTVEQMNMTHDAAHRQLCEQFGTGDSLSLRMARGEKLTEAEQRIAGLEENAVLAIQRWLFTAAKELG